MQKLILLIFIVLSPWLIHAEDGSGKAMNVIISVEDSDDSPEQDDTKEEDSETPENENENEEKDAEEDKKEDQDTSTDEDSQETESGDEATSEGSESPEVLMTELPCLVTLRTSYAYTLDREKTKINRGQVLNYRISQKYKNAVSVDYEGRELYMLKKYVEFPEELMCPLKKYCAEMNSQIDSFVFRKKGPRPAGKLKAKSLYPVKAMTQGPSINPIVALEVTPGTFRFVSKNQINLLEKSCDDVVEERQKALIDQEKAKIKEVKAQLEIENQKKIEKIKAEEELKRKELIKDKRRINFSFSIGSLSDVDSSYFSNTRTTVADESNVGPEPNPIVTEIGEGSGWFSQACIDYDLIGRLIARTRLRVRGCGRYEDFEVKIKGKDNPDPNPPAGTTIDDLSDVEQIYSVSNLGLDTSIFTHTSIGDHNLVLGVFGVRAQYFLSEPVQFRYLTGNIFKNTEVFLETGPEGFDQKFYSYIEYHYNLNRSIESIRIGAEFTYDQQLSFYLGFAF